MASNLIVARGGVEYVPPISLAFWRWTAVFLILLPFTYSSLKKNFKFVKQEYKRIQKNTIGIRHGPELMELMQITQVQYKFGISSP